MAKRAIRGVNLGGWLVLEPWITPSLFGRGEPDEFTFCRAADDEQRARLKHHRQTFITEKDFKWLAEQGIGAVRIPVGYWIFGDYPPYTGAIDYLDKAFDWARTYGTMVLVGLHGAPGSQNGEQHSGMQCEVPAWHSDPGNIEQTVEVIGKLAARYADRPNLLGFELLNEPSKLTPGRILRRYYRQAYRRIRYYCGPQTWVVYNDGLNPQPWRWAWAMHWPFYRQTYMDTHSYQMFTPRHKALDVAGHLAQTRGTVRRRIVWNAWHRGLIVGEWSLSLDPQSLRGLEGIALAKAHADYGAAQLAVFERADAWFYWTYRTEAAGAWSFRQMVERGILHIPKGL